MRMKMCPLSGFFGSQNFFGPDQRGAGISLHPFPSNRMGASSGYFTMTGPSVSRAYRYGRSSSTGVISKTGGGTYFSTRALLGGSVLLENAVSSFLYAGYRIPYLARTSRSANPTRITMTHLAIASRLGRRGANVTACPAVAPCRGATGGGGGRVAATP